METIEEYLAHIHGYDELLRNEKIKQILNKEFICKETSTFTKEEDDDYYRIQFEEIKNNRIYNISIALILLENSKLIMVRKEERNARELICFSGNYDMSQKETTIECRKVAVHDKYIAVKSLKKYLGYTIYTSHAYFLDMITKIGGPQPFLLDVFFQESVHKYAFDRLSYDNYCTGDKDIYFVCHNGQQQYISQDELHEDELRLIRF